MKRHEDGNNLIRNTLANAFNYFTTFLFHMILAYRFGTERTLSILIVIIGVSTSIISIFANSSQVTLLPSLSAGGRERDSALHKMWMLTLVANLVNIISLYLLIHLQILAFKLDQAMILFYLVFGLMQLFALQLSTIHLSTKKVTSALYSPAIPSLTGSVACAYAASLNWIMFGLVLGTLLQIVFLLTTNCRYRVESKQLPTQSSESKLLFLNIFQYAAIAASSILQKITLQNHSFESLSIFNYADRIASNAQGIAMNGISTGLLSEWSQPDSDFEEVERKKRQIIQVFQVLFLIVVPLASFGEEIVALCFQRGKFGADITLQVSQLLILMQVLIVLQTVAIIWANMLYSIGRIRAPSIFGIIQSTLTIVTYALNWNRLSALILVLYLIVINGFMIACKLLFIQFFYRQRKESPFFSWFAKTTTCYVLLLSSTVAIILKCSTYLRFWIVLTILLFVLSNLIAKRNIAD